MSLVVGFLRSTADWYRPFLNDEDMAEHEVDLKWATKNYTRREFFIAELPDGTPVGTVSLQYFGEWLYVGYAYLDADYVGRELGAQLMGHALAEAQRRELKGLALIAHPKATWATRSYLKFGYRLAAEDKSDVLAWNDGVLTNYYEEGFQLYLYPIQ